MDITYPGTSNCVSDFKIKRQSTQPADTCVTCPTRGFGSSPLGCSSPNATVETVS